MAFTTVVFYILSAILLFSAFRVITAKNPVHAALYLVLAFFTSAGHWVLLEAEFLAISLVLVYVGAVMVLFLFVVMMLDINIEKLREGFWRYFPLAATVGMVMAAELVLILMSPETGLSSYAPATPLAAEASNVKTLGLQIYTTYLYPFELAAVVLLVAIVAAIALTQRKRKDTKFVDPSLQVQAKKAGRVRLVKMSVEKPVNHKDEESTSSSDNQAV